MVFMIFTAPVLMVSGIKAQPASRMGNPVYTQTVFTENFNDERLDSSIWNTTDNIFKSNLYILTGSAATVGLSERGLELSMHRSPGYQTRIWTPDGEQIAEADFIGGEVMTKADFTYGIFECNATLAYGKGAFPAFWLYNDTLCSDSERPEIDIVELKAESGNPTLDAGIWYYPKDCLPQTHHGFSRFPFTWGGPHTFRAIWTPERIEFWVDDTFLKAINNTGQHWYPYLRQHVILSQQVVRSGALFQGKDQILTPQTSIFHWVRVREFFPAPEIHCPASIWETVIATMDVDSRATGISWELTPKEVFSGKTSGSGITAEISPATRFHASGKITYRFIMPSGEKFTAEKTLQINGLQNK